MTTGDALDNRNLIVDAAARCAALAERLSRIAEGLAMDGYVRDRGEQVAFLGHVMRVWAALLGNEDVQRFFAFPVEPADVGSSSGLKTIADLGAEVRKVQDDLDSDIKGIPFREVADSSVNDLLRTVRLLFNQDDPKQPDLLSVQPAGFVDWISKQASELNDQRAIWNLTRRAEDAVEQAEASANKASAAAGKTSEAALSSYYETLATDEKKAADGFRIGTIATGIVAGLTAAAFLVIPELGALKIEPGDYVHLIQRAIITAAIFGMAGYLARQAHQHRSLANWAGALAVQLKTFEAYLDPIDDQDTRNELRKAFAARAFGDHPAMKGDPSVTPTAGMLEKAMEIVGKTMVK